MINIQLDPPPLKDAIQHFDDTINLYFRDPTDISEIPCVSKTICPPSPAIGEEPELSYVDQSSSTYSCPQGNYLDLPSYPTEVQATCKPNQIIKNILPFWKIEGIDFPLQSKIQCLSGSYCKTEPPKVSDELFSTWDGHNRYGCVEISWHMKNFIYSSKNSICIWPITGLENLTPNS